jgi:hypothetical protein
MKLWKENANYSLGRKRFIKTGSQTGNTEWWGLRYSVTSFSAIILNPTFLFNLDLTLITMNSWHSYNFYSQSKLRCYSIDLSRSWNVGHFLRISVRTLGCDGKTDKGSDRLPEPLRRWIIRWVSHCAAWVTLSRLKPIVECGSLSTH